MSNILKVELDTSAVRDILRSSEVADVCETEAARRTRATGMEYVTDVYYGRNRVNAGSYDTAENVDTPGGLSSGAGSQSGKVVSGYYRTLANGKTIYVQSYRRKT